jgi:iron(III) transport system permease protein
LAALGVVVVVLLLLPLAVLVRNALAGGAWSGVLPAGRLVELAANTFSLVAAVASTSMLIGLATAWVTSRTDLPGRRIWSTMTALPLAVPSYVGALCLLGATGRQGLISALTISLGLGPIPIPRGFLGAWLVLSLFTFPYVHLTMVPAFRALNAGQAEAARGLGADRRRLFFTVTLPQLAPALRNGGLLVALYTMADFGAVSLLQYDTFTRAIYLQYAGRLDRRPATLLAVALIGLALLVVWGERRSRRRMAILGGHPHRPLPVSHLTRRARIVSFGLLSVLTLLALVVPVSILIGWWARGPGVGGMVVIWGELARSLFVSGLAATLVVAVAVPLAILTIRYRSAIGSWVENVTWSVYGLPHLTVGLAILLTGLSLLLPLYQTLSLLLLAYLTMFLPQALGPARAALRKVAPSLEEASRSLGRSAFATAFRVTIPLIGSGLAAGGGLVFLTTMKELPATLLLRPTGFETLAVRIWSATSEGFYARASLAALVLLVFSAIPLHVLIGRDTRD